MIRTKEVPTKFHYDVHQEPIIINKEVLDLYLSSSNPADAIALYCFYYYTAKWQKTDSVKATTSYVAKGLKWSEVKVRKTKNVLKEFGVISTGFRKNSQGRIISHYIKVYFRPKTQEDGNVSGGIRNPIVKVPVNAFRRQNINKMLLEDKNKKTSSSDSADLLLESLDNVSNGYICQSMFDDFWNTYPKKVDKGKTLSKWKQVCNLPEKEKPKWRTLQKAIILQSKTERWQDPKYIPNPTTWLNQHRWLDDPAEMNVRQNKPTTSGFVNRVPQEFKSKLIQM